MIEFTSGDLLQSDAQFIAQGVAEGNQEGLGTGLALKISKRWPDVQSAFKKHARSGTFNGRRVKKIRRTQNAMKHGTYGSPESLISAA